MKNTILEKECTAQNWAKSVLLSIARMERDCPRRFVPEYSNRLVFNILNGPECFSGLGDTFINGGFMLESIAAEWVHRRPQPGLSGGHHQLR